MQDFLKPTTLLNQNSLKDLRPTSVYLIDYNMCQREKCTYKYWVGGGGGEGGTTQQYK